MQKVSASGRCLVEVTFTETTGGLDNELFGEMFVARDVPGPGTLSLLGVSLLGLGVFGRRRHS